MLLFYDSTFSAVLKHFCLTGGRLTLKTSYISLNGGAVDVESGGFIDGTGSGFPAGQGPGSGNGSVGGSYASAGGNATMGKQYGSLFKPTLPGSGGGGGAGGAWLEINTGGQVHVDGIIHCNGVGDQKSSNGGGTGGTIIIKTPFFKGYGSIESIGGNYILVLIVQIYEYNCKLNIEMLTLN